MKRVSKRALASFWAGAFVIGSVWGFHEEGMTARVALMGGAGLCTWLVVVWKEMHP